MLCGSYIVTSCSICENVFFYNLDSRTKERYSLVFFGKKNKRTW